MFSLAFPRAGRSWFLVLAAAAWLAGFSPRAAGEEPSAHAAEIRALVGASFDLEKGPGVAILVSRHGQPLFLGGFGLADIGSGRPVTPDTLFDLASVSKHMTAVAILTLAEKGKLRLDDPVAKLLPDYRVPVKGRAVTVRDLLTHVSGLADYTGSEWDGTDEEFAALTTATHLKWLNGTTPRRAPGVKFEYNNTEYVLLSRIVEVVTGGTFLAYQRANLFEPAGMKSTTILDGSADLPATRAKGYASDSRGGVKPSFSPTVITGDGNVYSSVRDLAAWDRALRRHTIIGEASQEAAWKDGALDNGKPLRTDDDGTGYGFGWYVDKNRPLVSHSGSWDGTATYLLIDRRDGYTVAVLSNDENAECETLAESLLEMFQKDGGNG